MKKQIFYFIFCLLAVLKGYAESFDGVHGLVQRRAPWLAKHIQFEKSDAENESFTLRSKNGKIVVEATGVNAAAVGVNWYLKYYCHRSMSHMGDQLTPLKELPVVDKPVTVKTSLIYRYALNYCTYNYTMSFYTWDDWQWELDWMALNGVNMMLVANGSEAVWQNVLRRMDYSEKEIYDFITGPGYNAWWLMGNIEGWGGPMPQSQIDSRKKMVQKMLARMKSLGIEPLMPGFYGMVPSSLKNKSKAHIIAQGNWGAFVRPDILDPLDPEFDKVAAIFYEETRRLYGSDIRFFSGDPFHEGGTTDGVSLGDAGRAIQNAMQKHYPESVWVLQGWQDNPKPGLLEKLDKRYVLVQELFGENTNNWETRRGYEGTPFIWATVTNFGERPGINGKLQRFVDEVYRASNGEFAQYMKGVGILPEGINNNPVTYELLLELVWHQDKIDVEQWIESYITARYGRMTNEVRAAWKMMLKSIYSSEVGYQEGPPENILCARPSLELKSVSSWGRLAKKYDLKLYKEAALLFAKALPEFRNVRTYRIDLIHFLRQVIANEADSVFADVVDAYQAKDMKKFEKETDKFLAMIDTENELLSQDPFFRLSTWQQQAKDAGGTSAEKSNNLHNLMMLITYWGEHVTSEDNLHDYAYKEWAGMMNTYYKERWIVYFDYLCAQLRGEQAKAPDYFHWEREWVEKNLKMADDAPRMSLEEIVNKITLPAACLSSDLAELTDTKPVDEAKWEQCKSDYNSAWGSTDVRYSRTNVPATQVLAARTWKGAAWKGEKVNALALLWTKRDCKNIRAEVSELKGSGGAVIPASAIRAYFLRYIMTDELSKDGKSGCGYRTNHAEFDSSMVADVLDIRKNYDIKSRHTQPVWISCQVPSDTPSGTYRGKLTFPDSSFAPLDIELKVSGRQLPPAAEWAFHLDLWQNPYSVARYHQVPLWSKEHFAAMRSIFLPLANAGQKCITASIMYQPWGGQTEDPFDSMVMRVQRLDGSWQYNYEVFDRWVEFMMSLGIDREINCYSLIPWKLSFRYYDQASDGMKSVKAEVGTAEYRDYWLPFLKDFARHLKEKGWFGITTIAMDERPMEQMQKAIALIREADADYKVALAGNYHDEIESDIYDYSIASGQVFPADVLAKRQAEGKKSTYYTCCTEARPNMFTFSPPAESSWLAWYAAAENFDGYLRWAYNSWVKEPLQDTRFRTWAAGDCFLFYPGGRSSVRMEKLLEGIQDFEKVRILKAEFRNHPAKLKRIGQILSDFRLERLTSTPSEQMVDKARKAINNF